MWPKSRPAAPLVYQPVRDPEQQQQNQRTALQYPNSALPQRVLLGGDNKINQSTLLRGNVPIAGHLLLQPRRLAKDEDEDEDEGARGEDGKFDAEADADADAEGDRDGGVEIEHLDYLEPTTDDRLLTSRKTKSTSSNNSNSRRRRRFRITLCHAGIIATCFVLILSGVVALYVVGGETRPRGPHDYRG